MLLLTKCCAEIINESGCKKLSELRTWLKNIWMCLLSKCYKNATISSGVRKSSTNPSAGT